MQALAEANDLAKSQFDKEKFKNEQWIAFTFIKNNTSKIEINLNGKLNSIYFPTSPECKFLSAVTIKEFNYHVDRSTNQSKIQSLMDSSEGMIDEMNINFKHSKSIFRWIDDKSITLV